MQRKRAVKSIYVNFRFLKLQFRFEKLYVVVVQRKTKKCIKKYVARAELLLVERVMHVQSCSLLIKPLLLWRFVGGFQVRFTGENHS